MERGLSKIGGASFISIGEITVQTCVRNKAPFKLNDDVRSRTHRRGGWLRRRGGHRKCSWWARRCRRSRVHGG